jgi:hypothetical protein
MISSEVQRTLVKSPPELWAELSDPAALARHLGELGEIRITRTEPEKTIEWEAPETTGRVTLAQSGWGTKVTLSVIREPAEPEHGATPEPTLEAENDEPEAVEPTVEVETAALLPDPETEPDAAPELEPPRGFFARLFRRRRRDEAVESDEPEPFEAAATVEPAPEAVEIASPVEPQDEETPEELPDISAELKAAEEAAAEQVTAVLTAALDRLGAAHHRPFSRA